MRTRSRHGLLAAALLMVAVVAAHAADAPAFPDGAHEKLVERVTGAQTDAYTQVLTSLDAHLAAHPDDVVAAVERCRFIEFFASSEENFIEAAVDESQACGKRLAEDAFAEAPQARLYLFEQRWGEEATENGEALVPAATKWPAALQARLHERLATLYASTDIIKAGRHAMRALHFDPKSDSRLVAAEYLIRIGAKSAAVRTINAMPKEKWESWQLGEAVKLLVGMDDARNANAIVQANASVSLLPDARVLLARALFASGATDAATRMLKGASVPDDQYVSIATLREWFELERDYGSAEKAQVAYRRLREAGYTADPFGRHRLTLSLKYPGSPWQFDDVLGIGAFLLVTVFCALLPMLIVVPLHYRSVVKQLRGQALVPASPSSPWSLKHVAYALGALLTAGTITVYFADYPTYQLLFAEVVGASDQYDVLSSERQLAHSLLIATAISVLAMIPLFRGVDIRALLLGHWSVKRSIGVGMAAAVGLLIVSGIFRVASSQPGVLGTDTTRSLQGIHALYGVTALFLFAAVLIPILEEFVFRGVLLRAISRYAAVWVAVLVQAIAFMVWHEDYTTYPVIILIALLAAWLARRSGGLLAPIALHATNNAFAMLSLVGVSRVLQQINP